MFFNIEELNSYLESKKVNFEIIKHETPIISTQDAKRYFELKYAAPALIVEGDSDLMLFIVSAKRGKLDFKKIGEKFGFNKLKLADRKIVEKEIKYEAGNIPLIGIDLPCIFDNKLLAFDYIYGGSGDELHTLKVNPKDLIKLHNIVFTLD